MQIRQSNFIQRAFQDFIRSVSRMFSVRAVLTVLMMVVSHYVSAQTGTGGLEAGTDQANDLKTWAYGFLGVAVFLYLMYLVIMALMDKRQWSDVLQGLGYVAAAGGILVAGAWAWSIWGTATT